MHTVDPSSTNSQGTALQEQNKMALLLGHGTRMGGPAWEEHALLRLKLIVCQGNRSSEKEQRGERRLKDRVVFFFSIENVFSI